jgi:hypothetical protein
MGALCGNRSKISAEIAHARGANVSSSAGFPCRPDPPEPLLRLYRIQGPAELRMGNPGLPALEGRLREIRLAALGSRVRQIQSYALYNALVMADEL